ncbi:MAG TPA: hypothetical protein VEY09_00710 [Pyrinomonadaceae bacterium]|nr:hypothetical protein [Pyrinomonadaceae bacterium]
MPDVMAQACTLLAVGYSESGENSSTTTTYSLCGGSIVIYETTVTFYANGSFSFSGRLVAEIPLSSLFWV